METLFTVLHVTAAVFIIGPMAILPMSGMRAMRAGSAAQVSALARSTALVGWLSLIVALLGFALVPLVDPADKLTYATPWLLTSIIVYAIAVTMSLSGVAPLMKRAAAKITAGTAVTEYRSVSMLSGIVALLLVAVVVLMVWRP